MGSKFSKKIIKAENIKINDYSKVKIPKEYTLLKVATYNVSLSNTINLGQKIKEIFKYIISKFNNKEIDIINIQELSDNSSLYVFISEFKKYCLDKKFIYYFSPPYDNIEPANSNKGGSITTSDNMIGISFKQDSSGKNKNDHKKKILQNVIISRYPIISNIFTELDDKTDMDDILGVQTLVGVNILIGNSIISVYNTNLSKDIKAAQIINNDVRKTELDILLNTLDMNKESLSTEQFASYTKSGIHIVTGTFNIPEIDNNDNSNNICEEYKELLFNNHFIDIFRILNETDYGFTTSSKERINYIFLHMTKDFYEKDSEYLNVKELKKKLFKRYGIHFLDFYILENINSVSSYYPIECVFIINHT